MSFKKKMKIKGNEIISQYSHNPYLIKKEYTNKKMPLWAKISIPSSLAAVGAVVAIVIANSFGKLDGQLFKQINQPNKVFNSAHSQLNEAYVQSVKDFAVDYFLASQQYNYDGYEIANRIEENGNILFSPLSLTNELYMLHDATSGKAKEEIKHVLHYDDSFNHLEEIRKMILNTSIDMVRAKDNRECFSNITNAFFSDSKIAEDIKKEYLDIMNDYYFADFFQVNFNDDKSREMIADYINEKTNNMFNVKPTKVDPFGGCRDGLCVDDDTMDPSKFKLYDSTYLRANWAQDVLSGGVITFTNHDGSKTENLKQIGYHQEYDTIMESDDYYIIQVPLMHYNFNILLPKNYSDNSDILTNNIRNLLELKCNEKYRCILDFHMPEFDIIHSDPASSLLQHMGIKELFDNATFDGMLNMYKDEVSIDYIKHAAGISVDSKGVEASAYTHIEEIVPLDIEELPRLHLTADKPFLYSVTNYDGLPLYVGQVYKL